jgi:hypothetical protein
MKSRASELEPILADGNFDYFNKTPEDYKSIVLNCIQKIVNVNNSSLSNTGKIYFKIEGQFIEKEENTLKIFYQLVDTLEDLLTYYLDDKAKKEIITVEENLKTLYEKYFLLYLEKETNEKYKYHLNTSKIIPKETNLGKWCYEQIENETKRLYRQKFQSLLLLFKRKNDLSGKRYASMDFSN